MMGKASGDAFPVVFFDGEQDTKIGEVVVVPSLNLKSLQSIISERIGISPQQFSIYLMNREKGGSRIPVTSRTNFSEIYRERSWFFLVVLRRSRRERRRKGHEILTENTARLRFDPPPGNLVLLRRDSNGVSINENGLSNFDLRRIDYERRVRELQMEKERYLINMGCGSGLGMGMGMGMSPGLGLEGLSLGEADRRDKHVVCEECLRAENKGTDHGFHSCAHDAVTYGFRSSAGPIARPVRRPT